MSMSAEEFIKKCCPEKLEQFEHLQGSIMKYIRVEKNMSNDEIFDLHQSLRPKMKLSLPKCEPRTILRDRGYPVDPSYTFE